MKNHMNKTFSGVLTALVTPFDSHGAIDWESWKQLLTQQMLAGIHGVIPCGTTGESPTLTKKEKLELVSMALQVRKDLKASTKIIPGSGSYSTAETLELCESFQHLGVDGLLIVTPYYNKPSQKGMYLHYSEIARHTKIPVLLYNVPGRTGVSLSTDTIEELSQYQNIVGIKEATGNLSFALEIRRRIKRPDFSLLTGDDATYHPFMTSGGDGVISVITNILPRYFLHLHDLYLQGRTAEAFTKFLKVHSLTQNLFLEGNPTPCKAFMHLAGSLGPKFQPKVRLPLAPVTEGTLSHLRNDLETLGSVLKGEDISS